MQGRRGRGNPFFDFGDPFAGFGDFGSIGPPRSLVSSFLGGRDLFDDPFFTNPLGGSMLGSGSSFFGSSGPPFPDMHPSGFLEHQAPEMRKSKGPIIEELDSDDENKELDEAKENPRKHGRSSNEPCIKDPDDEVEEKRSKHLQYGTESNRYKGTISHPQTHSFTFQSSTVRYGGANGAYYTSSRTKRTGSDGVTFEESKEANSATREANHKISRGIHSKGHSVVRKLKSDGKVDSMETLHNLNEDELAGFEEAWKEKARQHLPGWNENYHGYGTIEGSSNADYGMACRGGWALPAAENAQQFRGSDYRHPNLSSSHSAHTEKMKTGIRDKSANHPQGRGRN